ncbi:hybrid sensor histidine kinase/response regulator [Argonema galeatum]|uniref:hybrid sensor histidine kinase/response regulator n=1 Tax=Argonema galeatum TaxID=2942762 RepID=UPI002010D458|nr:response regulator [Argonema galeatum]MCL1464559.1 hybrid sensor histidine kinase/response regulator [Argonema galeatum A003/A1]
MNDRATGFILIVDDNSTNLSILSQALKQIGLKVRMAMDGTTAINIAQQQTPELILLDVMMPGIDGFETCTLLKANPSTQSIPVIFMTALADSESKVKGLSLGAVDYITKPFEEQEVIARVNIHLQLRHLTKALEDRSQQLDEKNLHIEQAMQELKRTQAQLILAEKMSGLGQIVAGIAHEINNPITFIYGNIAHANEYVQDLLNLIKIYQHEYPHLTEKLLKTTEDMDLDFLTTDIQKLFVSMQEGAKRIRQIVLSLRTFSRLDESEMKAIDIHEGIESSLLILQHRLKVKKGISDINVIKEYGKLPTITCYASQLNQVFFNILNNAIDSLEEAHNRDTSLAVCIRISTEQTCSKFVKIKIADNGVGMTQEVLPDIFNPFFTTKPVGSGTGLGLAISYQIVVEKHLGQLSCISAPFEGAEFIIEIPIKPLKSDELNSPEC